MCQYQGGFQPRQIREEKRAHLGEVHGLFAGRVSTADDGEGLPPEDGDGAIADRAGRDTTLPVRLLSRDVHPLGTRARRNDQRLGRLGFVLLLALAPVLERPFGQINFGDRLGVDGRSEADGLSAEEVHHLRTTDAFRETGKVFNVGGGGELTSGGEPVGEHSLKHDGVQVGAGGIDRGRVW